jgi:hypothetical protein
MGAMMTRRRKGIEQKTKGAALRSKEGCIAHLTTDGVDDGKFSHWLNIPFNACLS